MTSLFTEIAIVMLLVFVISYVANKVKQPLLVGYILTGVVVGPIFLDILSAKASYEAFSHIGVALLLFIVGLHLNIKLIKEVGIISLVTGMGQILFTTLVGYLIITFLGYSMVHAILIALALTFSSTIIIVKLLSDNHGIQRLYGKVSLGFLLVQDFVAALILMGISSLSRQGDASLLLTIAKTIGLGFLLILAIFLIGKYFLAKILKSIAETKELLFVFVIAWCFGVAQLFQTVGFSLEIGALLAGVVLASSPYHHEISSRVKPLRDFFLVMFFIFLGTQLVPIDSSIPAEFAAKMAYVWQTLSPILVDALLLSLFVLLGNPVIVFILVILFGYSSKTGFLSGLTVSQISEFSLILALIAKEAGFLSSTEVSLITLVAVITITASTYLIIYGEKIYAAIHTPLERLQKRKVKDSVKGLHGKNHDVILFGFSKMGYNVHRTLKKMRKKHLVIDYNPRVIHKLKEQKIPCVFGDASNIEFIAGFDFKKVQILISTVSDFEVNSLLLENFRAENKDATLILTATGIDDALELYERSANYVIVPNYLGGHHAGTLVEEHTKGLGDLVKERVKHIRELKKQKTFNHKHL